MHTQPTPRTRLFVRRIAAKPNIRRIPEPTPNKTSIRRLIYGRANKRVVCVCLCVCIYISGVCVCVCAYLSVCLSLCVYISLCVPTSVSYCHTSVKGRISHNRQCGPKHTAWVNTGKYEEKHTDAHTHTTSRRVTTHLPHIHNSHQHTHAHRHRHRTTKNEQHFALTS